MKMGAVAGALLAGLIAGAAAMLIAEFWDKHLRSRLDVERELGVPFAGVLPDFKSISPQGPARAIEATPAEYLRQLPVLRLRRGVPQPARLPADSGSAATRPSSSR